MERASKFDFSLSQSNILFHEAYPEATYSMPFSMLYEEHRDEELCHKLSWYIILFADINSSLREMPEVERQRELETHFLKDRIGNYPSMENYIAIYQDQWMSPLERSFVKWKNKLDEMDSFMTDTPLNEGTYEMILKLAKEYPNLLKIYEKAETELLKQLASSRAVGSGEESLADKGEI